MIGTIKYVDLFAGVGGFRVAMQQAAESCGAAASCVYSSEIDEQCRTVYSSNFNEMPDGDITLVDPASVHDHDILLAGFPCQSFSIIGNRGGLSDPRGSLFFRIVDILAAKRPSAFILENVKSIINHDGGRTFETIIDTLSSTGYSVRYKVLNAINYGLPHNRERVFIVGTTTANRFAWPSGGRQMLPLEYILESNVDESFYVSDRIRNKRSSHVQRCVSPAIWHENKSGIISSHPYSCALRAGASYNYLLVDGVRRLTGREMFRLQGFPDSFIISSSYAQSRKQAGNSLPIPVASAVIRSVIVSILPAALDGETKV
jgi:DNA (cytosine-5)-methyltransferase 1